MHLVILAILFPKRKKKRGIKHHFEIMLSWILNYQVYGNLEIQDNIAESSKSNARIVDLVCFTCVFVSEEVVYF